MARTTGFVLLALVVVSFVASAYAASFPKGPCNKLTAVSANGKKRTVNFDELTAMSSTKPFSYDDKANEWTYEFAICANSVKCENVQAAACQETEQWGGSYYPLGSYTFPPKAVYNTAFPKGAISFSIAPMNDRGSLITVICDPKAKTPTNITVVSPSPSDPRPFIYELYIGHKSACGSGGLSVGWILFITLIVCTFVYFVGGFIILRFVMKRETMAESIPQYEFWSDLPTLCKDGAMFVVGKVRGAPTSYETVA